ncbi:hypothetical protein [Methylobacterium sp. GXS13]|uniref:hypothetical protein n=1 Tax=Methylobacterium sp. GXS13 TaxID=1730094 RepID=UPI000A41683B|nr:hypothetical protein [Methylobacterium sp. GXS13]
MRMSSLAAMAAILLGATQVQVDDMAKTARKPFNVTIRVFDSTKGPERGQDYVLPVDSPNAEHAVASTTANAASFTETMEGG